MLTLPLAPRIGLILLGLWGGHGRAQNLVPNPDFNSSLAGWTVNPNGTDTIVHDSTLGSPSPGSALGVDSTAPSRLGCAFDGDASVSRCVALPDMAHRFHFGMRCRPLPGQASNGGCYVQALWFADGNCSIASLGYSLSGDSTDLGAWQEYGASVRPDGDVRSVSLKVGACKFNSEPGPYYINIDHAFVYVQGAKGDFDDDGRTDLVLHNVVNGDNRIWFLNGTTRLSSQLVTPAATGRLIRASDDFDGDGHGDLVLRENTTGDIEFWLMNGADRVGAPVPLGGAATPGAQWNLVATGDFSHDRRPDLLWRNGGTQELIVWTMFGAVKTGEIVPSPNHAVDANWSAVAALDFDNDGNADLLWYNATSGKIVLWRMDANVVRLSGDFTSPSNAGNNNWQVLAAGDYGAGPGPGVHVSNDLVWRNSTSGKYVVWHMDPTSVPLTRTSGVFTDPDAPANATEWTIVGPR